MDNSKALMSPTALLLCSDAHSHDCHCIEKMLDHFGIPWIAPTLREALRESATAPWKTCSRFSILMSATTLSECLQQDSARAFLGLLRAATSVFVYGFHTTEICCDLLREIAEDTQAEVRSLGSQPVNASITQEFPAMCGPLSGLEMQLQAGAADSVLVIRRTADDFQSIVNTPDGHLFARFTHAGVRFFVDASQTTIDIDQRSATYFDVKRTFAGAVPIAMYLKWSFRELLWKPSETSACLIIDDPPLRSKHGFLDYGKLLHLIDRERVTATIGFIPWNWKRTSRGTVAIIQDNLDRLSICMHGCDHYGDEFAIRSIEHLDRKLKIANRRMKSLFERTGLHHDNIQVFPRGAFCPELGLALKNNNLAAAVNTEAAPSNLAFNETTIADLWSIAVLRYGGFPIFTRRYMDHGIENFAFDGLLGKPCFIAGHHDLFRDDGKALIVFLDQLKSLSWELNWRTLGNAVFRSYGMLDCAGITQVRMFAEQMVIENIEETTRQFTVLKEQPDIFAFKAVTADCRPLDYQYADGCIRFLVSVPPRSSAQISCEYLTKDYSSISPDPLSYRLKVAVRRHLAEARDTYVFDNEFLRRLAAAAMRLAKQPVEPSA